jgi:hypothetical protein
MSPPRLRLTTKRRVPVLIAARARGADAFCFPPFEAYLGPCQHELLAAGLSSADAETLLVDIVRDGRRWREEVDRNGPLLYFGESRLNNQFFDHEIGRRWGWLWLREHPHLNIDASTIRAPRWPETPPPATLEDITRETLRPLGLLSGRDLAVTPAEWADTPVWMAADDFFRILESFRKTGPDNPPELPAAAEEQESPPQRRKGRPRDQRNRVISEMQKHIDEGLRTLDDLLSSKLESLALEYNTSTDTASRALEDLASKNTQK